MKKQARVFLDCEFTSLVQGAQLASIAMVSQGGKELYIEISDVKETDAYKKLDNEQVNWLDSNVFSNFFIEGEQNLVSGTYLKLELAECARNIDQWLSLLLEEEKAERIEFWGETPAYDWVLFCNLWGGARNIPNYIHYIIRDLNTFLEAKGIVADTPLQSLLNEKINGKIHNALYDARVCRSVWKNLN